MNQIERLSITPTTAAVIADNAPCNRGCELIQSMYGAPANIHKKHGIKVTHKVKRPAINANFIPPSWKAARKPTNSVTNINGPGVVSARPNPSII